MAERGFGEPTRRDLDREVFEQMEFEHEERVYRESKLFAIASIMLIASLILAGCCIWLAVARG